VKVNLNRSISYTCTMTGKARRPTVGSLTAEQTIAGRGLKSLLRRDVSGARELPKVQRSISVQRNFTLPNKCQK